MQFRDAAALSLVAGAMGLFLGAATTRADDGKAPPPANKAGATAIEYGKVAPGEKATIYDDSIKPVQPKANPQGTIYDDGVKPVQPKANPQGTIFDDSVKPANPAAAPKAGTTYDDGVKPVAPKP